MWKYSIADFRFRIADLKGIARNSENRDMMKDAINQLYVEDIHSRIKRRGSSVR
jgi:hypothetical protein